MAVSKRHKVEDIFTLVQQGHRDFGENYLQEGVQKICKIEQLCKKNNITNDVNWHFIGHIQSRKCKEIAQRFHWVHTIDSAKVANKLNQHRQGLTPLNVHIQINLQQEQSKSGVELSQLSTLMEVVRNLPNLHLRGLMIIPKIETKFSRQRQIFSQCSEIFQQYNAKGYDMDHLSMGMTEDMEAAIAEGATQIRVGTAIFGPRPD